MCRARPPRALPDNRAMHASPSIRQRLVLLMVLGNLGGAILTFVYFHEVDPIAGGIEIGAAELGFFAFGFSLLSVAARIASARWMRPIRHVDGAARDRPPESVVRRRPLLLPRSS